MSSPGARSKYGFNCKTFFGEFSVVGFEIFAQHRFCGAKKAVLTGRPKSRKKPNGKWKPFRWLLAVRGRFNRLYA